MSSSSLLQPRFERLLVPPTSVPSKSGPIWEQLAAVTDLARFRSKQHFHSTTSATNNNNGSNNPKNQADPPSMHHCLCWHPVQPLVAYILMEPSSSSQFLQPRAPEDAAGAQQQSTFSTNNMAHNHNNQLMIVVQHLETGEIVASWHWLDVAATVYGETDAQKLPAAGRALGRNIVSLQFQDPSSLFWSRLGSTTASSQQQPQDYNAALAYSNWQTLAVQTDRRILLLNLRRGPASSTHVLTTVASTAPRPSSLSSNHDTPASFRLAPIVAHLCEKTLGGGVPSSNALAVSDACLLVGCADGSMKCFDWRRSVVTKKIKGLGKGDCVIQLLAANPYATGTAATNATSGVTGMTSGSSGISKRILTVTKLGSVYLIEVTLNSGSNNTHSVDIHPPLARLQVHSSSGGGSTSETSTTVINMQQQCRILYDGHSDMVYWTVYPRVGLPSNQQSPPYATEPTVYVWNLKALQSDFVKNRDTKSLFKPDPSLVLQFPVTSLSGETLLHHHQHHDPLSSGASSADYAAAQQQPHAATTANTNSTDARTHVATGLIHTAVCDETVLCATITGTGHLCWHGVSAKSHGITSTTPIAALNLKHFLMESIAGFEDATEQQQQHAELIVYAILTSPLAPRPYMVVATNWGLVVLSTQLASQQHGRHVYMGALLMNHKAAIFGHDDATLRYGTLEQAALSATVGRLEPRSSIVLYESSSSFSVQQHQPTPSSSAAAAVLSEVFSQWPFRLAPVLIPSPTGTYLAVLWPLEYRYEILHTASLLQQVGQQQQQQRGGLTNTTTNNTALVVASGTGVADLVWVSDEDDFAVLHAPDWMASLQIPKVTGADDQLLSPNLKMIGAGVANLATTVTKGATGAVTKGATNAANMTVGVTTKAIRSGAKGVTMGVKKSLGLFSGGKKKKGDDSIMTSYDEDYEEESSTATGTSASLAALPSAAELEAMRTSTAAATAAASASRRRVELKRLETSRTNGNISSAAGTPAVDGSGGPLAVCRGLGDVTLRGGNRNLPTAIFGGPVLCVASRSEEDKEGHAHFYARSNDRNRRDESLSSAEDDKAASPVYQSSGPTLPFPDLVTWDEDGRLCAICVANRVAVYLLGDGDKAGDFVLLGTVRIGSPIVPTAPVTSATFLHGALYCCTWDSVHCVFIGGNLDSATKSPSSNASICHLDSYLLASTDVPKIPEATTPALATASGSTAEVYPSLGPVSIALPLVNPSVLGYQNGSLLVSTLRGVHAIPLNCPLMRIGLLLASGQVDRAVRWFDAVSNVDHEALATFLERRGKPELALELPGLSLETIVDLSMRCGYVERLEEVVETFGVSGLQAIDMGRGVSTNGPDNGDNADSVVVCVGAYLLAHGRLELARRLASECLHAGAQGKRDAFVLGALLLQVDEADATRLIHRAVGDDTTSMEDDWLIGNFARDFVL